MKLVLLSGIVLKRFEVFLELRVCVGITVSYIDRIAVVWIELKDTLELENEAEVTVVAAILSLKVSAVVANITAVSHPANIPVSRVPLRID